MGTHWKETIINAIIQFKYYLTSYPKTGRQIRHELNLLPFCSRSIHSLNFTTKYKKIRRLFDYVLKYSKFMERSTWTHCWQVKSINYHSPEKIQEKKKICKQIEFAYVFNSNSCSLNIDYENKSIYWIFWVLWAYYTGEIPYKCSAHKFELELHLRIHYTLEKYHNELKYYKSIL